MKRKTSFVLFALLLPSAVAAQSAPDQSSLPDLALQPPRITAEFDPDTVKDARGAQGVPALERTANGRLWASWYAGPSQRGVESLPRPTLNATFSLGMRFTLTRLHRGRYRLDGQG